MFIYLRSALFLFGQVLITILVAPFVLIFSLGSLQQQYFFIKIWAGFNLWWLKLCCGLTYRVTGINNVPDYGCLVVSNHQSAWETIVLNKLFPQCAFVLKKELFKLPFFGWALAKLQQIPIDRSAGIRALDQVIKTGTQVMQSGRHVIIFPEGTRVDPEAQVPFNVGGAMLAVRSDAPVLPVAHNAGVYWPRHSFLKKPGVIEIHIGPVMRANEKKARAFNTDIEHWIKSQQRAISGIDLVESP